MYPKPLADPIGNPLGRGQDEVAPLRGARQRPGEKGSLCRREILRQIKRLDVMDRHDCGSSVAGWQAPTEVMSDIGSRRVARQQHRLGSNPVHPSVHRARDPGRRVRCQRLMRIKKPIVGDDAELNLVGGMLVLTIVLVIMEIQKVPLANYLPALVIGPTLVWWWML